MFKLPIPNTKPIVHMKRLSNSPSWLLWAMMIGITLVSCQKNADDSIPQVSSKDPSALSEAITVWHGKRTTGTMPSPSNTTDIILGTPDESSVPATPGYQAFIHTNIQSGDVAGYYVQINGANEYFKIDYTKPVVVQSTKQQGSISTASIHQFGHAVEPSSQHRSPFSVMGSGDNFNDSIIVINIPANIKTPDTVCVTYMAYDFNNHVSNPVSTCIYVSHLGGDSDSKWLEGTWNVTKAERIQGGQVKASFNYIYNKWIADLESETLDPTYITGRIYRSGDSTIIDNGWGLEVISPTADISYSSTHYTPHPGDVLLATDSIFYRSNSITLAGGKYTAPYSADSKYIQWNGQLSFNQSSDNSVGTGSWSFDSKTQKLIIITEYTDNGNGPTLDPYMQEYILVKSSDNQYTLSYNEVGGDGNPYTVKVYLQRQ
jgi:hypothetical protein